MCLYIIHNLTHYMYHNKIFLMEGIMPITTLENNKKPDKLKAGVHVLSYYGRLATSILFMSSEEVMGSQ